MKKIILIALLFVTVSLFGQSTKYDGLYVLDQDIPEMRIAWRITGNVLVQINQTDKLISPRPVEQNETNIKIMGLSAEQIYIQTAPDTFLLGYWKDQESGELLTVNMIKFAENDEYELHMLSTLITNIYKYRLNIN